MKMNKSLKKIIVFLKNEFLYGGHLQCLSLISVTWAATFLMGISSEWSMLAIIYLSSYIAYAYNRYQEIEEDSLDNVERTNHLRKYQKKIPFLAMTAFIIMLLILLPKNNVISSIYILFILVLGFFYTQWFKPATKKIPLFKNISVSAAFVLGVGFIFPYNSINPIYFEKEILFIGVFIFLRILFMQVFLDLKDCQGDSVRKLKTMAAMRGKKFTLNFLKLAFPISMIPLIAGAICGFLPMIAFAILPALFFDYLAINLIEKNNQAGYLVQGACAMSWPALLILSSVLF